MAGPSVTYTFSNSTTADATQVNQNFTDLINGATDGTKDYSISALTCAGAVTMNGNVTLGNATGDDITVTGSLASSIPIKTTASYDIGSSTLGLRYIYFGNSTYTVRVAAPALAASWNLTLPWGGTVVSKTSAYTVTAADGVVLCDATSAAFTITLPAAADYDDKVIYIKKTDSSANAVTIDGNASETIDGSTTTTLNTQNECIRIVSDGTNWQILERRIPSAWTSYTPTFSGFGTVSGVEAFWRRVGDSMEIRARWISGTSTATGATVTLPTGYSVSTSSSKLGSEPAVVGKLTRGKQDTAQVDMTVLAKNTENYLSLAFRNASSNPMTISNGDSMVSSGDGLTFFATVPVDGWNG